MIKGEIIISETSESWMAYQISFRCANKDLASRLEGNRITSYRIKHAVSMHHQGGKGKWGGMKWKRKVHKIGAYMGQPDQ